MIIHCIFFQVEGEEWQDINKELKKHGLPVVKILHPSDVTLLSGKIRFFVYY